MRAPILRNLLLASAHLRLSWAADCNVGQPRQEGDPSGQQIVNELTANNNIEGVCSGTWRLGDVEQLENTYNYWGMMWTVARTNNQQPLLYCKEAMQNIMQQCISNDNYWGGVWSLDGENYTIYNSVYPSYPLLPKYSTTLTDSVSSAATTTIVTSTSTAEQGPITLGPQTSIESVSFATTTQNIDGLTANSATSTTADDHATVLPIWYIGPGVGIIVIPISGVIPGGIVPPPPGFPPLTIGPDGSPSSADVDDNDQLTTTTNKDTSTTSTTSTCDSCASCTLASVDDVPEPTDIADIGPDFPFTLPGGELPKGTTSAIAEPAATKSAVPIDEPYCNKNDARAPPSKVQLSDGNSDITDLLYRIRQQICAGPCVAPVGAPTDESNNVVNVTASEDGGRCEIAVRIFQYTEAYMYRTSTPEGDQWQECWASTEHIINNCVSKKKDEGWWNGNHVYQFYQGGLRLWQSEFDLAWLPPQGISHPHSSYYTYRYPTCTRGDWAYEGDPVSNLWKRFRPERRALRERATGDNCVIPFKVPSYPETSTSSSPGNDAAQNVDRISKWWDYSDTAQPGLCTWQLNKFTDAIPNHKYATEHIYEKHFIATFLNWLSFDNEAQEGAVTNCAGKKSVFNTRSTTPSSRFSAKTPAQALADELSWWTSKYTDRASEFLILEQGVNQMKHRVLGRMTNKENLLSPSNAKDRAKMRTMMVQLSMVFAYMRENTVSAIFNKVNDRMRAVLKAIDNDPFYAARPSQQLINPPALLPTIAHASWTDAYDHWMSVHLSNNEIKSDEWMEHTVRVEYPAAVDADASLTDDQKAREKDWAAWHRGNEGGMFHNSKIAFGEGYMVMMGSNWKVRND